MKTKFDIQKYKEQRDTLKKIFEAEKTGDQNLFIDQERLFKPLIETQEKTSKATQDKIVANQEATSNALVPIARELQKRIDQMETLQDLPYYNIPPGIEDAPQSTPQKHRDIINVDLDAGLSTTDLENLGLLELDKPSDVQKKGTIEGTLKKIETENRSIGQHLGAKSKKTTGEKEVLESQKITLERYRELIKALKGAEKFIKKSGEGLRKPKPFKVKRGRGRPKMYPDTILYNNSEDLYNKLIELITAKEAGNTGLDNTIISALDELLNKKWISKDVYDGLFKKYFLA
jgi:hypothetical protein